MELKSDLSKIKVGDWVLTLQDGYQKVIGIAKHTTDYPIIVAIADDEMGSAEYTLDGKFWKGDVYPTCFPAGQVPPQLIELYGPPPVEFKDGEPVWYSDDRKDWYPGVYKEKDGNIHLIYSANGTVGVCAFCRKWGDKP